MTGLQMQLLMSLHMHSQTNKQTQECSFIRILFLCVWFFFIKKKKQTKNKQTIQAQNKLAFPISDSILKIYVSVCFSLTFYETCVETGTGIWISFLIS